MNSSCKDSLLSQEYILIQSFEVTITTRVFQYVLFTNLNALKSACNCVGNLAVICTGFGIGSNICNVTHIEN